MAFRSALFENILFPSKFTNLDDGELDRVYEEHPRRGQYQPRPTREHKITIALLDIDVRDL
jgi:hypothetical protein